MYNQMAFNKIEHNYTRRRETTGTRIRKWCDAKGCTVADLQRACDAFGRQYGVTFSVPAMYNYVHDKFQPKIDRLTIMSLVMGVSIPWLTGYGTSAIPAVVHITFQERA